MNTFNVRGIGDAFAKGDFIAIEYGDDDIILYYDSEEDRSELASRMSKAGIDAAPDRCSGFNFKQCQQAGGCCKWITSGSFNYCKCI